MKPLISVIIPVYRVEAYLRRAVDSVLGQTYRNLDIILVDDGSDDRCPGICDEYAAKEARVRVIHKENGGLSDARNAGLDVAGGDYYAFLDSDDYYAPCFIEVLYDLLIRNNAQVAQCFYAVTGPGMPEPDFKDFERRYQGGRIKAEVYDRRELLEHQYDALHKDATYYIVAWNKLYAAGLWKDVRFPKGKIHEDEATTYKIFDRTERGASISLPFYAYFSAAGSITRTKFSRKRLDWMEALSHRIDYFLERDEQHLAAAAMRALADGSIKYYYPLKSHVPDSKEEQAMLKENVRRALKASSDFSGEGDVFPKRSILGYRIFLCSPRLYRKLLIRRRRKQR
ncbi:MAG: glycosyltransferase [Lachnospiraceae bacterium]|nr:glycosyltransferase [Lachnospiraceae bacterium]